LPQTVAALHFIAFTCLLLHRLFLTFGAVVVLNTL
jgi:hypothetical protein